MEYKQHRNRLEVYNEGIKRRVLAGILEYSPETGQFTFTYESDYVLMRSAIALGPEFPMKQLVHVSEPNELFPSLEDRIPDKQNPAYPEYCEAFGLSPDEPNQIILLTTIGRRGPSTFIFEPIYLPQSSARADLQAFRQLLSLSQWDIAQGFDIPQSTVQRIEAGKCQDQLITRLLNYYFTDPELALAQLRLTGKYLHTKTLMRMQRYYRQLQQQTATSNSR